MTNVAKSVIALLRDRFPPPEYLFATEVEVAADWYTGNEQEVRRADAIAIRLKRGLVEVHGFEVKVSRADLLNEVNDWSKSAAVAVHCDFFWLVLGEDDISTAKVPPSWGIMLPNEAGTGLAVARPPGLVKRPRDLDRDFIASVLRRVDPMEPRNYWMNRERIAENQGYAKGRNAAVRVAKKKAREGKSEEWPTQ